MTPPHLPLKGGRRGDRGTVKGDMHREIGGWGVAAWNTVVAAIGAGRAPVTSLNLPNANGTTCHVKRKVSEKQ
jgi:hypothetical protein